jgi:hypothetical protein
MKKLPNSDRHSLEQFWLCWFLFSNSHFFGAFRTVILHAVHSRADWIHAHWSSIERLEYISDTRRVTISETAEHSRNTVRLILTALRAVLSAAVEDKLIDTNPASQGREIQQARAR